MKSLYRFGGMPFLEGEAEEVLGFIAGFKEDIRSTGTSEGIDQGFKEMILCAHEGAFG